MPNRKYPPITRRQSPFAPPSDEQIARARQMYVEKFTISRILAACDMSLGTLYYWLDGGPRDADGPRLPPIPRRRVVVGKRRPPLATDQVSLVARLWRTAERQVRDIELRLAGGMVPPVERERDTRMLATMARLLRDLSGFAAVAEAGRKGAPTADDDAGPDNIDDAWSWRAGWMQWSRSAGRKPWPRPPPPIRRRSRDGGAP
jgi:hypothetical protein